MHVPSIIYHDVVERHSDDSGFAGAAAARYKYFRDEFDSQLDAISAAAKYHAVTVNEFFSRPRKHLFLFTVDDGGSCSLYIADQLQKRGWQGHFFVVSDLIGSTGFVSKADIRELYARGHVVGSHSCTHPHWMSDLAPAELDREWGDSVAALSDITGAVVTAASVPGGACAPHVVTSARDAGIRTLFNSEPTTQVYFDGSCAVFGRFSSKQGVSAKRAAALVHGTGSARMRQSLTWGIKRAVKTHARPLWEKVYSAVYRDPAHS